MNQEIVFTQGETFYLEEGDSIEFKDVNSGKPVKTIVNYAEEYVPGFINAQLGGDLYFGIDDAGVIKGVTLDKSDRDMIRRDITNKLRNTDPPVPHDCYEISIHNVSDSEQEIIQDLYVVKIHVISIQEECLYRTSGGSIYLKKGSSCIKLTSEEITKEIKKRTQVHLQKEADELDIRLKKEPNNRAILESRAKVAKLMGDIETMDTMYNRLLTLNPKSSAIRIQYATAHRSIGDVEGALSILNDAIQQDVNDSSILQSRGSMLLSLDRWNEAYQTYQEASKLRPDDYTIITQIGVVLRQLGKYEESIQFLNYALSKSPNYRVAKYEKKRTYYEIFKGGIQIRKCSEQKSKEIT